MKNYFLFSTRTALLVTLCFVFLFSCEEPEEAVVPDTTVTFVNIPDEVKAQFLQLGFDPSDLIMEGENYLVEGDILVTPEALANMLSSEPTIISGPQGEQYRTHALVDRNMKTIRVRPTDNGVRFLKAIDRAISNYNSLGLTFRMVRVPLNAPTDIIVSRSAGNSYLGRAEFPGGLITKKPGGKIDIDARTFDRDDNYIEHVITHELGHCVGMRHTDWYNRSLSCGTGGNEGQNLIGVGAEHIPGTPKKTNTPPDPTSIMNACVRNTTNGEFSNFDRIALRKIY